MGQWGGDGEVRRGGDDGLLGAGVEGAGRRGGGGCAGVERAGRQGCGVGARGAGIGWGWWRHGVRAGRGV